MATLGVLTLKELDCGADRWESRHGDHTLPNGSSRCPCEQAESSRALYLDSDCRKQPWHLLAYPTSADLLEPEIPATKPKSSKSLYRGAGFYRSSVLGAPAPHDSG